MSDDKIRNYFLGKLDVPEAEDFEESTAASSELTEHAQLVEGELIVEYLRGGLSSAERDSFENNYLITEARRQKLELARIFLQNIIEKPQIAITAKSQTSVWQAVFASFQLKIAFAAAILLFVSIAAFFFLHSNNKDEIAKQPTPEPATVTPETTNQANNISNSNVPKTNANSNIETPKNSNESKPEIKPSPTATPKKFEPLQPTFATFALLPGTLRSGGEQFVKIPSKAAKLNLNLTLPKDTAVYENYSITVKNSNSDTIFTAPNRKLPNFTIPAAKLENDTYIIFLSGNNAVKNAESITEYTFRVRR